MKTALITGGTGAIGKALCEAFSKDYEVIFTYNHNEKAAHEIAEKLGARALKCDISNREQVEKLAKECGNCHVLVNNAGISQIEMFTDISSSDWDRMIDVNLTGAYNVTHAILPVMLHNKDGAIINISSVWGVHGASCEVHYSAAKAGIIGLTKALAKEVGPSNVRVNCIAPGVIQSEMNAHLSEDEMQELIDSTPLMKIGTGKDVAEAALYLAKASFVTGQVLGVDGGFY